jgi:hypothetical protein
VLETKTFPVKPHHCQSVGKKQVETNHNSGKNDGLNHTSNAPDPEVSAKTVRRKFTTTYKLRILKEAGLYRTRSDRGIVAQGRLVFITSGDVAQATTDGSS